jgi:hypothetical protein
VCVVEGLCCSHDSCCCKVAGSARRRSWSILSAWYDQPETLVDLLLACRAPPSVGVCFARNTCAEQRNDVPRVLT